MAPLKISQIVSFSSEDPLHPASNLAKQGTKNVSWKCKDEGEKQAWVLCKLAETSVINSIDIGNAGSAFVEVQVGRTGMNTEDFRVLLVASSFMSPAEARVATNATRVRMFSKDKLSKEVADAKWDLVKFVCTQPFNTHLRYGLSFVTVTGPTAVPSTNATSAATISTPATLGAFKLKEDQSSSSLTVGSYFAKRKMDASDLSPAAALRSDATLASLALKQEDRKGGLKRDTDGNIKAPDKEAPTFYQLKESTNKMYQGESSKKKPKLDMELPKRNSLPGETESPLVKDRREKTPKGKREQEKRNLNSEKKDAPRNKKTDKANEKKVATFETLFDGVTFTISGFQNPLRGDIRGKALEMGAKYKADWDSQCTHLICAFANTPKFSQVKGKGKIVTKNWIEESYRKRVRLPWRRFYLDKADRGDESEEEIWDETLVKSEEASRTREEGGNPNEDIDTDEEIERANAQDSPKAHCKDSTENTDDEIERIKKEEDFDSKHGNTDEIEKRMKKQDVDKKSGYDDADEEIEDKIKAEELVEDDNGEYDANTDIDEDELPNLRAKTKKLEFDKVETYFSGKRFFLYGELPEDELPLLKRYIIMFGGKVDSYMASDVNYVITKSRWDRKFEDARKVNKGIVFLKPEWIFSCTDKRRIVSTQRFLVEERIN